MNIIQKPCGAGNWHLGRIANISAIVIHVMDGFLTGTDTLFSQSPEHREGALHGIASSAHYGISQTGEIHQYVQDRDTAYHAGHVAAPTWKPVADRFDFEAKMYTGINPNAFSIGIEHSGTGTREFAVKLGLSFEWPIAMLNASAELLASLCRAHKIPIDRDHIVGHHEIYEHKLCPGPAPLDRLVKMAQEIYAQHARVL